MALEELKQVTLAEEESDRLRSEAREKARRIIAEAQASVEARLAERRAQAQKNALTLAADAEKTARELNSGTAQQTQAECTALTKEASLRIERAAAFIVERIVSA